MDSARGWVAAHATGLRVAASIVVIAVIMLQRYKTVELIIWSTVGLLVVHFVIQVFASGVEAERPTDTESVVCAARDCLTGPGPGLPPTRMSKACTCWSEWPWPSRHVGDRPGCGRGALFRTVGHDPSSGTHSLGVLALTAIGKMIAYGISLGAGYRGGRIFPAVCIGVVVGTATSVLLPYTNM